MELSARAAADPSTRHVIIPRSKSIITTARTKNKNELRMIKRGETMVVMPLLQRRPQLPPITITTTVQQRNEEQECSRGRPSDVLRILDALHLPVDADTYSALIKECIDSRDAIQGASIHAHIQQRRTRSCSTRGILADRLLLMYAACGRLRDARQLFDEMPMKDAISRVTMIAALSDGGDHVEAIKLFVDMHENGCAGGGARFFDAAIAILGSCVRTEDLKLGQQVHGLTLKMVGSAACSDSLVVRLLVRLYSGCQDWTNKLLECMPHNDAAAWTSVINGYCKKGQFDRALGAFREMRRLVGRRDRKKSWHWHHIHNFQGIFRACAMVGDEGWSGMQVHADAIKTGLDKHPSVRSNLVRMYGKCGRLDYAKTAFNVISTSLRDAACWNAMLASILAHQGCSSSELLRFLWEMKAAGIEPQESIFNEVLFGPVYRK